MTSTWNGPYIRFKTADDGMTARNGTLSGSPDLIPAGGKPVPEPGDYIEDLWMQDPGTSTTAERYNFLYVRGANTSAEAMEVKAYLYYSPARLLQWPNGIDNEQGWAERPLKTGGERDYQEMEVAGKARFVTPSPFLWKPKELADDHYCLVGRVSTDKHPNPIPDGLDAIDDFARYISSHPDLGWRNVFTAKAGVEAWTDAPLYLQGSQDSQMVVTVFITNGRAGDRVTAVASEPGPQPPISMALTLDGKTPTEQMNVRTFVGAHYRSTVVITYEAASGQKVPEGLKAELDVLKVGIPTDSDLVEHARPLSALGVRTLDDLTELAIPLGATHYSTNVIED